MKIFKLTMVLLLAGAVFAAGYYCNQKTPSNCDTKKRSTESVAKTSSQKFIHKNDDNVIDEQIRWVDKHIELGAGFHYWDVYRWAQNQWDYNLNLFYKKLLLTLGDNEKKLLRKSQRDWLKFRDDEFEFLDQYSKRLSGQNVSGETISKYAQMFADEKKMEIIKNRALTLRGHYESVGGIIRTPQGLRVKKLILTLC